VSDPSRRRVVIVSFLVALLAIDLTIRSDRFLSLLPDHPIAVLHRKAQWVRGQPAVEALLVALHGGQRLDCRTALPDVAFYDVHHVRAGPPWDRFSEQLGALVARGAASCDLH
jgi:hypothetical protein